ncbi:hypothetical protein [Shewanella xiamenensis]|uniref:hypothetical protein n=1 Tax=Shewanella xiamenensis TaxID=332186 RepID=UPI00155943D3|nr:hypothetical protein [Shewanella xiamenensis]
MSSVVGVEAASVFNRYYELISNESDRGAVILSGSILDEGLKELLQKRLLDSTNKDDPLFNIYGPLGTFDSKIELSFRLGLIKGSIRNQLLKFKSIRNDFAHKIDSGSLSDNKNTSRLLEILKDNPDMSFAFIDVIKKHKSIEGNFKCKHNELLNLLGHRNTFNFLFASICMLVNRIKLDIDKIEVFESEG